VSAYLLRQQITAHGDQFLAPRSIAFIYCGFLFVLLFIGRYVMASLLAGAARDRLLPDLDARKIVIYGANSGGVSLAGSVQASSRYRLIGFVDADPALAGRKLRGVPVYQPSALSTLAQAHLVDEVFLALPKASRSERLTAISSVRQLGLEVKTVPAAEEIVSGRVTVSDIRPIDVDDLLRRDPVEPIAELMREAVEGRSILVTGAGGSIGAEICRQAFRGRPAQRLLSSAPRSTPSFRASR
jgi:FlaA1/EpsC-like NDP-sugar epimerase